MKQLPVFVYGTLMTGFGNHRLLQGKYKSIERGVLNKHDIYPVSYGGGFPCLREGSGIVHGEIYYIDEVEYENVMFELDTLEGYRELSPHNSMYIRKSGVVINALGEPIECYYYLWNRGGTVPDKVISGDWREWNFQRLKKGARLVDFN